MRVAAVQSWPQLANAPTIAPSAAASRLASANTTNGALPPSSMCTRLTVPAAPPITLAPVRVGPVRLAHAAGAGAGGAGHGDQRDVLVAGQDAPDLGAGPGDHVEHAGRQTG